MAVTYCDVFSVLWRSILSMSCFFDCFGFRNDSESSSAGEDAAENIRFSSLLSADEKGGSEVTERENLVRRVSRPEINVGLPEKGKLLRACGTLPVTPAEIRKTVKFSEQVEKSDMRIRASAQQSSPYTPSAIRREQSLPEASGGENSGRPHIAVESSPETPEEIRKVEYAAEIAGKLDVQGPHSMTKASPYPTPRNITDDMQTPGTVYATNMKSLTKGNTRICSQYVYTVLNCVDDLNEEISATHLPPDHEEENPSKPAGATPLPTVWPSGKSIYEEKLGSDGEHNNQEAADVRNLSFLNTPGDSPIIGLVDAHWNEQEKTPHIPPKWWDGNGIPNSTTNYKEDQKVCWHATPFEERLERVLSEETRVPQRKPLTGAAIIFEESEGQDTATSQLQTAPKSVVSF